MRQFWANSNAMQPDVHNTRKRGKALPPALMELLVMEDSGSQYERARIVCSSSVGHGRILPSCSVVQDAVQHTTASARCALGHAVRPPCAAGQGTQDAATRE